MSDFLKTIINEFGMELVNLVLVAIFGYLAKIAKKYLNDKTKQDIAKIAVQSVEQVYKTLHGEEKLNKALEHASSLLAEKGIKCTETEMHLLIENAVGEFNKVFDSNSEEVKKIKA